MKTLLILRHAKSAWDDPAPPDHERPLAPRGVKAARRVGRHLARHFPAPTLALCSTARRAEQTLERVLEAYDRPPPVELERGLYLCGSRVLLERLRDAPASAETVMLVAHNPDLHELATDLAGAGEGAELAQLQVKFPTAACAVITFEIAGWRDVRLGSGRLAAFIIPRKLA